LICGFHIPLFFAPPDKEKMRVKSSVTRALYFNTTFVRLQQIFFPEDKRRNVCYSWDSHLMLGSLIRTWLLVL